MSRFYRWATGLYVIAFPWAAGAAQSPRTQFSQVEVGFDSLRYLRDQIAVTVDRGAQVSAHGQALGELVRLADSAGRRVRAELAALTRGRLSRSDRVAFDRIGKTLQHWVGPPGGTFGPDAAGAPDCRYDARAVGQGAGGPARLTEKVFGCYGHAASRVVIGADTLNRLTALGMLGTTDDPSPRERIFRALEPIWQSVNGADEPTSPYRVLVGLRRASWSGTPNPFAERAAGFGLTESQLEGWLVRALEGWRATLPDTVLEPWDFHHFVGAASRRLSPLIPRDSLIGLNRRFYETLGAPVDSLGVRYDLDPRPGKYPTSYTTFGARPILKGGRWVRSEPWIFTSYQTGGLDILFELLHETGHAVHMAAIRARPAFADWPESDTFTEGIADLAALEVFEPLWQRTFVGRAASLTESIRAKYGGVVMDIAWALFELRVHRPDAASPNVIWGDLMSRYFKIRPHPELSWWAMRGQLVESPGYMMNYALGAFVVADLRRALAARLGPIAAGRPGWYRVVSDQIFQFGAARAADRITRDVLGRRVAPEALIDDLARIRRPGRR